MDNFFGLCIKNQNAFMIMNKIGGDSALWQKVIVNKTLEGKRYKHEIGICINSTQDNANIHSIYMYRCQILKQTFYFFDNKPKFKVFGMHTRNCLCLLYPFMAQVRSMNSVGKKLNDKTSSSCLILWATKRLMVIKSRVSHAKCVQ